MRGKRMKRLPTFTATQLRSILGVTDVRPRPIQQIRVRLSELVKARRLTVGTNRPREYSLA